MRIERSYDSLAKKNDSFELLEIEKWFDEENKKMNTPISSFMFKKI